MRKIALIKRNFYANLKSQLIQSTEKLRQIKKNPCKIVKISHFVFSMTR